MIEGQGIITVREQPTDLDLRTYWVRKSRIYGTALRRLPLNMKEAECQWVGENSSRQLQCRCISWPPHLGEPTSVGLSYVPRPARVAIPQYRVPTANVPFFALRSRLTLKTPTFLTGIVILSYLATVPQKLVLEIFGD